jgi:hypothetical protein
LNRSNTTEALPMFTAMPLATVVRRYPPATGHLRHCASSDCDQQYIWIAD